MEVLAEKINEYENTIDGLRTQLAFKDDQINMLQSEVVALNENINGLTMELENQHEHITEMTDKLHHQMEEKEGNWQFERDRLQQKFEKELHFLRDNEISSNDQKTALNDQLKDLKEKNEELEKILENIKNSNLKSDSEF